MKSKLAYKVLTAVTITGAVVTTGQPPAEDTIPILRLETKPPVNLYHLGVCYSLGLNIKADFKNLGDLPPSGGDPGSAMPGGNHVYDDGYNLVDITGNNHGGFQGTWNWGYQNASQISGDSVAMHGTSWSKGGSSMDNTDDPQHGLELVFGREISRSEKWRWGLEGAFGFTRVKINDRSTVYADRTLVTDTYGLNGTIPPVAPYNGTYQGPGSIISDAPNRTTSIDPGAATITGSRELDAQLFILRLGPYLETPLNEHWTLRFRGGLALVDVNSDFTYTENTSVSGLDIPGSGHGTHNDLLVGGFVAGEVSYNWGKATSVFGGVQFQGVGDYTHSLNGRKAVLDLGRSVFVVLGLSYSY